MRLLSVLLALALCAVACTSAAAQDPVAEISLAEELAHEGAPAPARAWPWLTMRNATLPPPHAFPVFCPLIHAPVCGTNNVTYVNRCVAVSRNASVAYVGACEGQDLWRPYSFGRPHGGGGGGEGGEAPAPAPASASAALAEAFAAAASAPAPAPASASAAFAEAFAAAASAPAPASASASELTEAFATVPSAPAPPLLSLAAALRAQPLNSELAAAAKRAESRGKEEDSGLFAPAPTGERESLLVVAEAAKDEPRAEMEVAEELEEEEKGSGMEAAADGGEEASASAESDDSIILAPSSPPRPPVGAGLAACPRNYMPVCPTLPSTGIAKTFDNDCLARAEGATATRPGGCSSPGGKTPGGVILPGAAAASSPDAAAASSPAAAAAAAATSEQVLATPATRRESSSYSAGFSSFAQRSPPSTRYRLPAIESPEEQAALEVGGGRGGEV